MTRPDQGLPSLAPGDGKRRDPGNEVVDFVQYTILHLWLSDPAYEWQRGCRWLCFDTKLFAFLKQMKASWHHNNTIYMIKTARSV